MDLTFQEPRPIRVLIIEESHAVADFVVHLLTSDPRLRVVATILVRAGALEIIKQIRPDVITIDIRTSQANSFDLPRRIMETCPTPLVIVNGSDTRDAAANFKLIEAGAVAVALRPVSIDDPTYEAAGRELIQTVRLMSEVKVIRRIPHLTRASSPAVARVSPTLLVENQSLRVVAVGASTGGPLALRTILLGLPKSFSLPILVVQHMARGFVEGFTTWLEQSSGFPVRPASHGEYLVPGTVYVAPDDVDMGVSRGGRILLNASNLEDGIHPSVSFLFRTVEQVFGSAAVGVLLTGMGEDGATELKQLKAAGAMTIVQDQESSVVFGMPGRAIEIGAARLVLPPEGIANALAAIVNKPGAASSSTVSMPTVSKE